MKKTNTNSPYTFIMEDFNGKFIRTYKRSGLNGYKRYIPLKKIFEVLEQSNVKHPKLLKNRFTCLDIEFIEGNSIPENFKKTLMLSLFCNTLFELRNVNCASIMQYIPYRNNSGYLKDIVNNLIIVLNHLNNYEILEKIGLRKDTIVALSSMSLDDNRPLSLIHGDFQPNNIIMRGNDYFIIDWEMATYGDIAYEIAMHLIYFEYDNELKAMMFERISQTLGINMENLINDVKVYIKFEYLRRTFLKFNRAINLAKKGKPFDEILIDGYTYYEKICNALSLEQIRARLRELYRG